MTETADMPMLPEGAFRRMDPAPDPLFYAAPRFVTHIDDNAIAAVTAAYRRLLPEGGRILDLMSSWVSHLPDDVAYGEVVGHGLNEAELKANPRLDRSFVQDLNETPQLPFTNGFFDGAVLCVSIQYLIEPVAVLAEVRRVLKGGAPLVISYSNRCFPTKAVAIWQALTLPARAELVALYLRGAGFCDIEATAAIEPGSQDDRGDPLYIVTGNAP